MSVTAIRKALENLEADSIRNGGFDGEVPVSCIDPTISAVVRVGLRACDEAEKPCLEHDNYNNCAWCSHDAGQMQLLADILREAGVEVEG